MMNNNFITDFLAASQPAATANYPILQELKKRYGQSINHGALLQCMYSVTLDDIFGIGRGIPWFEDKTLGYLVTDPDLSLGSSESESFYAGALPANYLTKKTADEMDLTFLETLNGDIANSFMACRKLAFNDDGTVNEPRQYAFKLTVSLINHKDMSKPPPITRSWLVGAKNGRPELSSTGRTEVVKETISFQKLRPMMFAR